MNADLDSRQLPARRLSATIAAALLIFWSGHSDGGASDETGDEPRRAGSPPSERGPPITLEWKANILTLLGEKIPGGRLPIHYLEAYCRPNSHTTDWVSHTVIGHRTALVSRSDDGTRLLLRCELRDGVIVDHRITAAPGEVDFRLTVRNATERPSQAHWAQPCVRVGGFTGLGGPDPRNRYEYLQKSFIFLDGELSSLPTKEWATEARYTPGQVWAAPGVPRSDVNPRPLSSRIPSHGLIGCFSGDSRWLFATAWEPCQELFQGVISCLHSDFRIGGLEPGETKRVRGKIYILPADIPALLSRYERDFPAQAAEWRRHGKKERREKGEESE